MRRQKTIAVSGYFLWYHVGHVDLFKQASELGNVIVIVNNDYQQVLKYGKINVPLDERMKVISSIKYVFEVIESKDYDRTVCKTLDWLKPDMFGNGGDRTNKNAPEDEICDKLGIQQIFNLGKKIQSSSELIKNANKGNHKISRGKIKGT